MKTDTAKSLHVPQIVVPKRYIDPRGWFSEAYHEGRLRGIGIACHFVQDNQSKSKRTGTLRGLHFQLPPAAQDKLVSVLHGRIFDVAVDVRRGSPSYGNHVATELSAKSGQQLYIPTGFAHGFLTLEDETLVAYKVSNYYAPEQDGGIRWDDPEIAIPWPCKHTDMILSEKDRRLPLLKDFSSPFDYDGHPLEPLKVTELA